LCPTTTFDGEPLYRTGEEPDEADIARRSEIYFRPYHEALFEELINLRRGHDTVVLYEAHSIRSRIPRLFDGELPQFNIGTNSGASCAPALAEAVEAACAASKYSRIVNGRFKGGWTTRHYGRPEDGFHAIQMELACRGYMDEPDVPTPENWPPQYSEYRARDLRKVLMDVIVACVNFAQARA
jgi:formiminoglutamase